MSLSTVCAGLVDVVATLKMPCEQRKGDGQRRMSGCSAHTRLLHQRSASRRTLVLRGWFRPRWEPKMPAMPRRSEARLPRSAPDP